MEGVLPDDTELVMVDTACSSSLYTIDIGVKGLLTGRQDIAVCGGSFSLAPRGSVLFSKLHGLSASGDSPPARQGRRRRAVLRRRRRGRDQRLQRALEDGDKVLAVLKAFGSSSDGRGKAIYAPSAEGQQIAVERALAATDGDRPGSTGSSRTQPARRPATWPSSPTCGRRTRETIRCTSPRTSR